MCDGKDTRTNESIIKFMNLLRIINPRENHSNTDHFQLQKHALYPLFAHIFHPFRGFGSQVNNRKKKDIWFGLQFKRDSMQDFYVILFFSDK